MNKMNTLVVVLLLALVAESALIVVLLSAQQKPSSGRVEYLSVNMKSIAIPYGQFNQPISNDTEYTLDHEMKGSWTLTIQSQLVAPKNNLTGSMAQVAIAPEYPSENLSIPTIIVQERGDGLLRIEYFAQDWPRTYGLVLYNSTSPSWLDGNVTLKFTSYGPPVPVNPQIAPYPNGNLTVNVGSTEVVSNYPIAWATLSNLYIYGRFGSNFVSGTVYISIYELRPKT